MTEYALSLKQPWATLLVHGLKTIEVRRWPTVRLGPVLIHAARASDERPEAWRHVPAHLVEHARLSGGFVGRAELTRCIAYRTREEFTADAARHLNDPEWFDPTGLYGFVFGRSEVIPFERHPGQMRFFSVQRRQSVQLLVSVRSAEEAEAALDGGAGIIDVKEPSRGSLGRADDAVIAGVVRRVAGRRPVSAAMGELMEGRSPCSVSGLAWVKWGLAGAARADWRAALREVRRAVRGSGLVAVAYADAERAGAPPVAEVCDFACAESLPFLLIDTWLKDGTTLLDWLKGVAVAGICWQCHAAGVRVAVAGSLRDEQVELLRVLGPDVIAVRGAACRGGDRGAVVDAGRVRELARLFNSP